MSLKLFWVFFAILLLLEAIFTSIPLVLTALLLFYIWKGNASVFMGAFFAGIVLDIFSLRTPGITSLFLLVFLGIVMLYERKFEIQTFPFVLSASFIGSFIYLLAFGYSQILTQGAFAAFVSGMLCMVFAAFFQRKGREEF